jgi:Leucine-rich repeat (LRR) protein
MVGVLFDVVEYIAPSSCTYSHFGFWTYCCSSLKRLLLGSYNSSGNKVLKSLPDTLGNLSNLEELILDKCKSLLGLPASICRLQLNLWNIQMRECKAMTELPLGIGSCLSLRHLSLPKCMSLTTLPDSIGNLSNLEDLILTKCKLLTSLPQSIGGCAMLSLLDLRNCKKLVHLPVTLGHLQMLRSLDLSTCKTLKELPESIGHLKKLKNVDVSNCLVLSDIPALILSRVDSGEMNLIGWEPKVAAES